MAQMRYCLCDCGNQAGACKRPQLWWLSLQGGSPGQLAIDTAWPRGWTPKRRENPSPGPTVSKRIEGEQTVTSCFTKLRKPGAVRGIPRSPSRRPGANVRPSLLTGLLSWAWSHTRPGREPRVWGSWCWGGRIHLWEVPGLMSDFPREDSAPCF